MISPWRGPSWGLKHVVQINFLIRSKCLSYWWMWLQKLDIVNLSLASCFSKLGKTLFCEKLIGLGHRTFHSKYYLEQNDSENRKSSISVTTLYVGTRETRRKQNNFLMDVLNEIVFRSKHLILHRMKIFW